MADRWQLNQSLSECNKYMLDNAIATDVKFMVSNSGFFSGYQSVYIEDPKETLVDKLAASFKLQKGDGDLKKLSPKKHKVVEDNGGVRIFQAHKYVLISRSPVFYSMFCGMLAEKGDVRVEDIEPVAFEQMLNYIYTESADLTVENIMCVLYAAKKYMLPGLETMCENFFRENLSVSNVCLLLDQCLCFQEEKFITECRRIIMFQSDSSLKIEYAEKELSYNTLEYIVCECQLMNIKEVELFKFCVAWAKAECRRQNIECNGENMKTVLGQSLYKLCFTQFTPAEIADVVMPLGILPTKDSSDVFHYLCATDRNIKHPEQFPEYNRFLNCYLDSNVIFNTGTPVTSDVIDEIDLRMEVEVFEHINLTSILLPRPEDSRSIECISLEMDGVSILGRFSRYSQNYEWNNSMYCELSLGYGTELFKGRYVFHFKMILRDQKGLNGVLKHENNSHIFKVTLENNPFVFCQIKTETKINGNDTLVDWCPILGAEFELLFGN